MHHSREEMAKHFIENAHLYGLTPEHLGRTFEKSGRVYNLLGSKPRATLWKFIGETEDGKWWTFSTQMLCMAFGKLPPRPVEQDLKITPEQQYSEFL